MIDDKDITDSTLRFILWKALREYPTNELLELLEDEDMIVRTSAAKQLQLRPEEDVYHATVQLVEAQKEYKREISAFVLGQLGTPKFPYKDKSIPILTRLFDDSSADVRATAVSSIGHLGSEKIHHDDMLLDKVIKLSIDQNEDVRLCCAYALALFIKSQKVIDALKKLLSDSSNDVKEWAELSMDIITSR